MSLIARRHVRGYIGDIRPQESLGVRVILFYRAHAESDARPDEEEHETTARTGHENFVSIGNIRLRWWTRKRRLVDRGDHLRTLMDALS